MLRRPVSSDRLCPYRAPLLVRLSLLFIFPKVSLSADDPLAGIRPVNPRFPL